MSSAYLEKPLRSLSEVLVERAKSAYRALDDAREVAFDMAERVKRVRARLDFDDAECAREAEAEYCYDYDLSGKARLSETVERAGEEAVAEERDSRLGKEKDSLLASLKDHSNGLLDACVADDFDALADELKETTMELRALAIALRAIEKGK